MISWIASMFYIAVNRHADLLTRMAQLGELPWLKLTKSLHVI